ncbi:BA3454 family stress response protein [Bacillus sp. V5-8f]|nr:BA3454 family stress response protein [Bacillus sp. V5-8f]PLT32925.1 hypothetical protein CUU64_15920 [Bacillus sp. V5-8f]
MVQVTVKVDYLGKSYQTNVLAKHDAAEEEIFRKALEQVQKQWTD